VRSGWAAYARFHWLSLDVVAGACLNAWALARYCQADLPPAVMGALALAVWATYTADHLWDAQKAPRPAAAARHRFHQTHQRPLLVGLVMALLAGASLTIFLPPALLRAGVAVALFVAGYFGLLHLRRPGRKPGRFFPKEVLVAFGYVAGLFAGPLALAGRPWGLDVGLLMGQYACLALANLLLFAIYSAPEDQRDGFESVAIALGAERARRLVLGTGLSFACLGGLALGWFAHLPYLLPLQVCLWPTMAGLLALLAFPRFFAQADRYRYWGDGVLCLPGLVLLY
jgi:hypothetical protein